MTHRCRFGLFLASAAAVLTAGVAPALAQEAESRFSLIALDGYRRTLEDSDAFREPLDPAADGTIYRWSRPFGASLSTGSAASPNPTATQEEVLRPWQVQDPDAPYDSLGDPYTRGVPALSHEIAISSFGAAIRGTAAAGDVQYDDFFKSGSGFRAVWRLHRNRLRAPGRVFSWGPMAAIDYASFEGDSIDVLFIDPWNPPFTCIVRLEADSLSITKVLAGVHLRSTFSGFFIGLNIGLGLAIISSVDVVWDETDCTGDPADVYNVEFYAETLTFAFDLEFRLGGKWDLGNGGMGMSVFAPFGVSYSGGPDDGGNVTGVDAEAITVWHFGLGISLEFGGGGGAPTTYLP